jgi:hypothetical protein
MVWAFRVGSKIRKKCVPLLTIGAGDFAKWSSLPSACAAIDKAQYSKMK